MSLQLYQVDTKSYLLDFKSLSPHIDDVPKSNNHGNGSLNSSINDMMGKNLFHDSGNNSRQKNSGKYFSYSIF